MNDALNIVIELNEQSIDLLERNKDQTAVDILSKALTMLQQLFDKLAVAPNGLSSHPSQKDHSTRIEAPTLVELSNTHDPCCFAFLCALSFDMCYDSTIITPHVVEIHSAGVALNTALIYHRLGMSHMALGRHGKAYACLRRAHQIYRTVSEFRMTTGAAPCDLEFVISIIVANNLGQINRELGDYGSSQMYFEMLDAFLTPEKRARCVELMGEEAVEQMCLNFITSKILINTAAAA